jgi:hypothetical protein
VIVRYYEEAMNKSFNHSAKELHLFGKARPHIDLEARKAEAANTATNELIMQKQSTLMTTIVLFALVAGSGPLVAASQVDQQQPVIDITVGGLAIGGGSQQKLAQVVTVGISSFLTEVRFPIADEEPNGIVLNSETFAGEELPAYAPNPVSFRSFSFSRPTMFLAGDQLAIVLKSSGSSALEGCGIFQGPAGDSYARGRAFFDARPNPEGVWICLCDFAGGGFDLPFQTVVAPPLVEVLIDILPGEFPNNINRKSRGKLPVAVLSTGAFDAVTQVDKSSLTFGATGDEPSLAHCEVVDVNGDGLPDLLCHFNTQLTKVNANDTVCVLKGKTVGGTSIRGTDSIRVIH